MHVKIKMLCIMLAMSSTWAYAKPKFEDVRVFEAFSRGAIFIMNGNEKGILSSPAGVFDIEFLPHGMPRGVFFIYENSHQCKELLKTIQSPFRNSLSLFGPVYDPKE